MSARSERLVIPADSPFFDGHFPGEPILPAVAQLLLVEELLRRELGAGVRIVTLESVRLLEPVRPGQPLTLHLRLDARARTARFTLELAGRIAGSGTLGWASA